MAPSAPSGRSRPLSATTTNSNTTASASSYYTDRSGIPGLNGIPAASTRPLPDLVNLVLEAAHVSHDNRKVLHPPTTAYSLFNWRVANAVQQSSLLASTSMASAGHSSTAVYAWTESKPATSTSAQPGAPKTQASTVGPRSTSSPPGISASGASTSGQLTSASSVADAANGKSANPAQMDAQTSIGAANPVAYNSPGCGQLDAGPPDSRLLLDGPYKEDVGLDPSAVAGGTATDVAGGGGAGAATATEWRLNATSHVGARGPREIMRPAVVARALSPWEGAELEVVCLYDSNFQTANRKGQHGLPLRVPSNKHIGPVSYLYRWYCKRSTQFRGEPPPWVLADAPAMPPPATGSRARRPDSAGPSVRAHEPAVAAAGATATGASAARRSSTGSSVSTGGGGGGGLLSSSISKTPAVGAAIAPKNVGAGPFASSSTFGASVWRPPPPSRSASGGIARSGASGTGAAAGGSPGAAGLGSASRQPGGGGSGSMAASIGGAAGGGGAGNGASTGTTTTSGRCLNTSVDPVISLAEVVDLLEDLEVVPHLASRLDIKQLFEAACRAAAPTAGTAQPPPRPAGSPSVTFAASAASQPQIQNHSRPAGHRAETPNGRRPASARTAPSKGPSQSHYQQLSTGAASGVSRQARTASAPRASATTTTTATLWPASAGSGGGGGSDGTIPRAQVHPEEVRFPVFKDLLVRLAVAIACAGRPYTSSDLAAAAGKGSSAQAAAAPSAPRGGGGGTAGAGPAAGSRVSVTGASSGSGGGGTGGVTLGWGRTMSGDEAVRAVQQLLERMGLYRKDLRGLRHRLDELARFAAVHSATAQANRRRYVAVPSPVAAAQGIAVAAVPSAVPAVSAPAAGGFTAAPPGGSKAGTWGVLSASPAPAYLLAVLAAEDQGDDEDYRPVWREFGSRALELGVLQPGEWRQCRMMLHARGPHTLSVRVDPADAPFCRCSHVGLHSVPPGMPLRLDVSVRLYDLGEVVGEIRLYYSSSQDRREREIVVPVYGMVCPPGVGASAATSAAVLGRTRPRAPSERSSMAAKAVREPVSAAVSTAASAVAPLGHRGPWTASTTAAASSAASTAAAANRIGRASATTIRQVYEGARPAWMSADGGDGGGEGVGAGGGSPDEGMQEEVQGDSSQALSARQSLRSAASYHASDAASAATAVRSRDLAIVAVEEQDEGEEDNVATELAPARFGASQDLDPAEFSGCARSGFGSKSERESSEGNRWPGCASGVIGEESSELLSPRNVSPPYASSLGQYTGPDPTVDPDGESGVCRSDPAGHDASDAGYFAADDELEHA